MTATIFQNTPIDTNATYLLTDSRQLVFPQQTIFFAIKGARHDGHQFLAELYKKGVRQFVIEQKSLDNKLLVTIESFENARIWSVESSLKALQDVAKRHRAKFDIPVIGITGSNGKTIVKEWLGQLLSADYRTVKSPKSYNSQIGVPLSVWQMNDTHTLGIFEAGISQIHEMKALQEIIQPSIGIFTNIGSAHDEGFRSRKQKVTEKLRLFTQCQQLIYRADYTDIDEEINLILKSVNPKCELISWGSGENSLIQAEWHQDTEQTYVVLKSAIETYDNQLFAVPFTDEASVENAIHCLILLLTLGIPSAEIRHRIGRLRPISMRLELKEGINNCYLIDDTYNNDLVGLTIALNFLSQQEQRTQKVAILSDLLQTGQKEDELYTQINTLLHEKGVQKLIAIGDAFERNAQFIEVEAQYFTTTNDFLAKLSTHSFRDSLVLIKGARPFQFERIVHRLQQKVHGTVLEINLDALTHNLNFYRNRVGNDTRIMVMVKAFAYGSGSAEVAQLLQFHRVDYLAVAYTDEGVQLRQNGIELPIMVMNPSPSTFEKLIEYQLEPEIYSHKILDEWLSFQHSGPTTEEEVKEATQEVLIHIKLDTGMHRLGFTEVDLPLLIHKLQQSPTLKVASVFSHLAGADEAIHNEFTRLQYERFVSGATLLEQALGYRPLRHILNSAGIVRFPDYKLDMVRLGIGLYGVEVNRLEQRALQQIGTFKTVVSQVKHLPAGETIGYSRNGILEKASSIATIAIGYADGFDRRFSKGVGKVLINGALCPVVGNVCMDMTMVDATGVTVQEGDEVIIFGNDLPIVQLADQIGTISYELLTGISERVKRVFYKE
ncbi:bifunctional UDP-N-acetylmuramoyl-tripeptide:D-alanyl-D-alanine ligase/alanine racemase [Runella sp. CRIBMP]|uniref:bifunctional UDP-N-acetylmuramoyl-tripeptide:D-alanyl-D-alanine ligase/alanine racemase n=1 Tax=Runella sp. CRIBMP TaxID=2683261 RepID=UPI0014135F40|nr:bifunctional UDP-N-acetylmuramoyl-tripeptide:D-alanyl-D-alanine ligase/alanine racemase [Runella sp. CRIBMP]NBB19210.1 bifunctional UDP-N-acetylmuramoyl-tripeptide:D-alanyl-D-alanine ligase/alanine racemase [Runella sp. CRIBMP]